METKEIMVKEAGIVQEATTLEVGNAAQYERAGGILCDIKALGKEIAGTFDPIIAKAHETHKEALASKKKHQDPLDKAERLIKTKMLAYAEAEREKAEAEKLRLEAIERKRIEDERLASAQEFSDVGLHEEAERFLDAPIVVKEAKVQAEPKVFGIGIKITYKAEVDDFKALVKSVAEGKTPIDALDPNYSVLNAWARKGPEEAPAIPGVRYVKESSMSARAS